MYSGGHGYFGTLLADARFARQGRTSFFRLFNNHWQILGLDTAWDDDGLKDPQASWVASMVADNPQRTMIMTHRQLFSPYENGDGVKKLKTKIGGLLNAGKIKAAIRGHEHRCILHKSLTTLSSDAWSVTAAFLSIWNTEQTIHLPNQQPMKITGSSLLGWKSGRIMALR